MLKCIDGGKDGRTDGQTDRQKNRRTENLPFNRTSPIGATAPLPPFKRQKKSRATADHLMPLSNLFTNGTCLVNCNC